MKHESMYLHPELETMTRPEIEKLQMERLQQTLQRCMRTPFYKQRFAEIGLKPEDIHSLDDLQKIPFTTKQATIILSDFLQFRWKKSFACILPAVPPAHRPLFSTPNMIWTNGQMPWHVASIW